MSCTANGRWPIAHAAALAGDRHGAVQRVALQPAEAGQVAAAATSSWKRLDERLWISGSSRSIRVGLRLAAATAPAGGS